MPRLSRTCKGVGSADVEKKFRNVDEELDNEHCSPSPEKAVFERGSPSDDAALEAILAPASGSPR